VFRDAPTAAPTISLSPDEMMNWVFYMNEAIGAELFAPTRERRPSKRRPSQQWRHWREQVWSASSENDLSHHQAPGLDGPNFDSLAATRELQQQCVNAWPQFIEWWMKAKPLLVSSIQAAMPQIAELRADLGTHELTIHVLGLAEPQDLATAGSHHLISVGLLQDSVRFRGWLRHQVSQRPG